jgi:aspartate/methionine/tyrosine aminotransferase
VLHDEVRAAIIDATSRTGTWLLADEVYAGAELSGEETPSFLGTTERVIATGSLSKAYGLPGLRLGWAGTDRNTAESLWAHSDYTTISPGDLTDALARIALDPVVRPQLLKRTHGIIREGLDILTRWLRDERIFEWREPDAGAICFARYDAPIESEDLAELLRAQHSVLIVPGSHFNLGRYIRFGIGTPADLPAALQRVSSALRVTA